MLKNLFKRNKKNLQAEELTEKQTTKLGYFLLVLMFIAILVSAQWSLNIISNLVSRPNQIPNRITHMLNTFEQKTTYSRYYYINTFSKDGLISEKNPKFDFTKEYLSLEKPYNQIQIILKNIQDKQQNLYSIKYKTRNLERQYNTSLREKIAKEENRVYEKNQIQNKLQNYLSEKEKAEKLIQLDKEKIKQIIQENKEEIEKLKVKYEKAEKDYEKAILWYKFKIALLSLLFISVIFFVVYKIYSRLKSKNSPYTIIFSVASFAYGLVFLQVAFQSIFSLLPREFLEYLERLFNLFAPLRYFVQFFWPLIIIGIFGFIVYKIQKRIYSPENIVKRIISDKKCPGCGNSIDVRKHFCPICKYEVQIKCPKCNEFTIKGLNYCENCGDNLKN